MTGGWCENVSLSGDHSFHSTTFGDSGGWQFGIGKIKMNWFAGVHTGWNFHGTRRTASAAFVGYFSGNGKGHNGKLVKGVVGC